MLTDHCLEIHWQTDASGPVLPWRPVPPMEVNPDSVQGLLETYEKANGLATAGQVEQALLAFDQGLQAYLALEKPNATQHLLGRSLLWGTGACLERMDRPEEAWGALAEVIRGTCAQSPLPLDLALNWLQSSLVTAQRLQFWGEAVALLNLLLEICWQAEIGKGTPVHPFVQDRWKLLEPVRLQAFEALQQAGEFEAAEFVCSDVLQRIDLGHHPDKDSRGLWASCLAAAQNRQADFRLQQHMAQQDGEVGPPGVVVHWRAEMGLPRLHWSLSNATIGSSDESRLWLAFAQASRASDSVQALQAYNLGLEAFQKLPEPDLSDRLMRWMLLWGKGVAQDALASQTPPIGTREQAWETLRSFAELDVQHPRPLPLLLTWTRSSLIVATSVGRFEEGWQLLDMLFNLAVHPEVRAFPELREQVLQRFLQWMRNCFDLVPPQQKLTWAQQAQARLEPPGTVFLPVREILWEALSLSEEKEEARRLAAEVSAWATQQQAPEVAAEWSAKSQ